MTATMTESTIKKLADRFQINLQIVNSWKEIEGFSDFESWEIAIKEHEHLIKAQPLVKWVWGKRQLISQFSRLLPPPEKYNDYFEPFLGWGAVYFSIQKKRAFLSDVNAELINMYKVVKENPEKLIKFLKTLSYDKECYYAVRAWDRQAGWIKKYNAVKRAGRFLYLNKTCFNWLHRVNSRGEFNVPIWWYKNPDFVQETNIRNISKLLEKTDADIRCESFERILEKAKPRDFIYFDPPYDTLSNTANFTNYDVSGFGKDMQVKLAETYKELDKRWCLLMLSNHDTPFIRELYKGFGFELVKARRSVNRNISGRNWINELVILNYEPWQIS